MDQFPCDVPRYNSVPGLGAAVESALTGVSGWWAARRPTLAQTQDLAQAVTDDGGELSMAELEQVIGAGCMTFVDSAGCSSSGHGGGGGGGGGTVGGGGNGGGTGGGRGH